MQLSTDEQAMLRGDRGLPVKEAIEFQIAIGDFFGAERFVPISNAHMMGDIEVMGDAGLARLQQMAEGGARCAIGITTNARCIDFDHVASLGQIEDEAQKERRIIAHLRQMNVITADTCINYQTLYQPHLGEHVAWGDTGTVIYANSVFGARTNFEGGPSALASAITGRTPAYGFHLDAVRRGNLVVELDVDPSDYADWGAIGKLVGEPNQSYYAVPVFTNVRRAPTSDELKHLGAALASYGSHAMFHMVGVTPEAPSVEAALGGNTPTSVMKITRADIDRVYRSYDVKDGRCNLVVFSAPQLSLFELKRISELLDGRQVAAGSKLFVTTSNAMKRTASELGYIGRIEAAGGIVLEGVCFYILQNLSPIKQAMGWSSLVTNSAKLVNTITAHRFNTILRRTEDCIATALSGNVSQDSSRQPGAER
ncbi:MAG: aconitase X catalytic domain-containing protein [Proteobacteria bacterium]|nr:aconitase X catalytic domain-containing protein [Burkholderiales bacterium]